MTSISDFSGSELELIISLPYKAGVFISHSDDEDGEVDDEKEMSALASCIQAIAKLHDDKPFTAEVMGQTLAMKSEWARWAEEGIFQTPKYAQQAVALLNGRASEQEVKNYRAAILQIATTVAQAYGEFGEFDDEDSGGGLFSGLASKISGALSSLNADDDNQPMNVSAAEEAALAELRAALKG